jgi:hypothetical protein
MEESSNSKKKGKVIVVNNPVTKILKTEKKGLCG